MRKSKRVEIAPKVFPIPLSKKLYLAFFVVLTLTSAAISLVPFRVYIVLVLLFIGTATGAGILALSIIDLLRR
ncbi:MAG: hypothetical protein WBZ29_03570 [Methanocella sp.]